MRRLSIPRPAQPASCGSLDSSHFHHFLILIREVQPRTKPFNFKHSLVVCFGCVKLISKCTKIGVPTSAPPPFSNPLASGRYIHPPKSRGPPPSCAPVICLLPSGVPLT